LIIQKLCIFVLLNYFKSKTIMKKVFAILAVASAFAFASCGEKKAEEAAVDSTAVSAEAEVVADSAATAAPADSAKADSAAAPAAEAKH